MTTPPDTRLDPYLINDNVTSFAASRATASAGLSVVFNRVMASITLACAAYGGLTDNKPMLLASLGLAVTHAANARYSRRREATFGAIEETADGNRTEPPLDKNWFMHDKPTAHGLGQNQLEAIGRLNQASSRERAVKYGNLILDFTALSAASYSTGHMAGTVVFGALGVWALQSGYQHWANSRKPALALGSEEATSFMKHNSTVLTYHAVTPAVRAPKAA